MALANGKDSRARVPRIQLRSYRQVRRILSSVNCREEPVWTLPVSCPSLTSCFVFESDNRRGFIGRLFYFGRSDLLGPADLLWGSFKQVCGC